MVFVNQMTKAICLLKGRLYSTHKLWHLTMYQVWKVHGTEKYNNAQKRGDWCKWCVTSVTSAQRDLAGLAGHNGRGQCCDVMTMGIRWPDAAQPQHSSASPLPQAVMQPEIGEMGAVHESSPAQHQQAHYAQHCIPTYQQSTYCACQHCTDMLLTCTA